MATLKNLAKSCFLLPDPKAKLKVGPIQINSFYVFSLIGFTFSAITLFIVVVLKGMSLSIFFWQILFSIPLIFIVFALQYVFLGDQFLTFYRFQLSLILAIIFFLWLFAFPIIPYLELEVFFIAGIQAFGRLGCYNAGCCHGIPCLWGVAYKPEHVLGGFPKYYVNTPLFPVQLFESVLIFVVFFWGLLLLLESISFGYAASVYIVCYGIIRLFLEFLRGDAQRNFWIGFSEAQWTSIFWVALIVVLGFFDLLPQSKGFLVLAIGFLFVSLILLIYLNFFVPRNRVLLYPKHLKELSVLFQQEDQKKMDRTISGNKVFTTSRGLNISIGRASEIRRKFLHITLSSRTIDLDEYVIEKIAHIIYALSNGKKGFDIVRGTRAKIFHVLIREK